MLGRFWTVLHRRKRHMGKPGVLKRPSLESGPLKDLNDALHVLHLLAGRPSISQMHAALTEDARKIISRSTLHNALTGTYLPRRDTIDALVEVLGSRARNTTPEQQLRRFDLLWQRAALAEMPLEGVFPPLLGDISSLISTHLSGHPEDTDTMFRLMEMIRQEAREDREHKMELLKLLLDRGLISQGDMSPDVAEWLVYRPSAALPKGGDDDDGVVDAEIVD
ncbi:hypothetical protein ACIP79_40860 [Streptomyces sp. NPDC088747]|uniref:hypothetical protein n=1 Tax=Streptomyces sp. NPDC088747 TaxID=3365886 RepID=UPI00382579B3